MVKQTHTISINFMGGIISPGYLHTLLEIAAAATVTQVRFGLRQQLLMDVPAKHLKKFEKDCKQQQITFHHYGEAPNITSSYAAADIFITDTWLSEGTYKDVFAQFDYTPSLKVNICDSRQTFTPFFTGHINWIAAGQPHYWHLFIRFPKTGELFGWPELIYTNHIGQVSRHIETLLQKAAGEMISGEVLYKRVKKDLDYLGRTADRQLEMPGFHLPYYEGFNRYDNHYWLGIYRRDEGFSVPFLKDVCAICLETKTGQFYATPWKSLIIKNIDHGHRSLWDYVLGKYGINVRHAANELNWQVEDNCEDALVLKRHIIRHFDSADVRTYGLCFSIRIKPGNDCFGAIVISKQENKYKSRLKHLLRYDISYTPDFNPNSGTLIPYRTDVAKEHLGIYITALCKYFYEKNSVPDAFSFNATAQQTVTQSERQVYQCSHCFTVYDETLGDEEQHIAPGTLFSNLPADYCCSLCEAPLQDLLPVNASLLGVLR